MAELKIVSDPYNKQVTFYFLDEAKNQWNEITEKDNPNGRLVQEKIRHGFFPFQVQKIIDIIYNEYKAGGSTIGIEFQGTDDEYEDLKNACRVSEHAETFCVTRGTRRKESADTVLPKINRIFNEEIYPLVQKGVSDVNRDSIYSEVDKYRDASTDVIPICVMGSYSVGKSTFINALLGMEILPSGTEPLTAKIVRIFQSDASDEAKIEFYLHGTPIEICFHGNDYTLPDNMPDCKLRDSLQKALDSIQEDIFCSRIRKTLSILNGNQDSSTEGLKTEDKGNSQAEESGEKGEEKEIVGNSAEEKTEGTSSSSSYSSKEAYEPQDERAEDANEGWNEIIEGDDGISVQIMVTVPFRGPVWKETNRHFVIFDTPGSNSASHAEHLKILQSALKGFSNGLPVFVTGKKELDTRDNENLQKTFREISELDDRFTMIVVNRADEETFPSDGWSTPMKKRILSQGIPRALYSGGIYFVSSVIGLGAKTGGVFPVDDLENQKVFDEHRESFENPKNRFYTRLYIENILPDQMKKDADADAMKRDDLLYVNSGLYSIERAIQLFAVKYSSYNKCLQAHHFLGNTVKKTNQSIEETKNQEMQDLERMQSELAVAKTTLSQKVDHSKDQFVTETMDEYYAKLDVWKEEVYQTIDKTELLQLLTEQDAKVREDVGFDEIHDRTAKDQDELRKNLKKNRSSLMDGPIGREKLRQFGTLLSDLGRDSTKALGSWSREQKAQRDIHARVSDDVTRKTNEIANELSRNAQGEIEQRSASCWEDAGEQFKETLAKVVMGAESLDESTRQSLQQFILQYEGADYQGVPVQPFDTDEFKNPLSQKLNLDKMKEKYAQRLQETLSISAEKISKVHSDQFGSWVNDLVHDVKEHIMEYSPDLRERSQEIKEEIAKISQLESIRDALTKYLREVSDLLNWKKTGDNAQVDG